MSKILTDEFLIEELHRFVRENGRVPKQLDMQGKFGYPSFWTYQSHFGSWNNALIVAGFEINHIKNRLDGTETCSYCGCTIEETSQWYYDEDGTRYCRKHKTDKKTGKPDYVKGNLDINSKVGLGRAGEILVAKTLKITNEFDCNRISCGYKIDLYHDEYKKIDVKTSMFNYDYNFWTFGFKCKKEINTYICLGLSSNRKEVEHVWVVPNVGEIKDLQNFGVYNTYHSLSSRKKWEVDCKLYNETWKNMSLGKCKIMTDKKKEETEEERLKHEIFKKAYFKKLGITE